MVRSAASACLSSPWFDRHHRPIGGVARGKHIDGEDVRRLAGRHTAGWAELVARLRPLIVSAIGLEPSGGYERGIIRALLAAGLSVRRINPNKLRQFARARGVMAKNDRLDARLIAEYVAI